MQQSFKGAVNYSNVVVIFIDRILIKEMGLIFLLCVGGGGGIGFPSGILFRVLSAVFYTSSDMISLYNVIITHSIKAVIRGNISIIDY